MKILTVHNYPDFACGGEGRVFQEEATLLSQHGHEVKAYECTNGELMKGGWKEKVKAFIDAPWSPDGYRVIRDEIRSFRPDIMHVHNFFFTLSPSIFSAAKDEGVTTVTTLHNYRLVAPCSQLLRNDHVCEKCVGKNPWRIMFYRCYRSEFMANWLRYRVYYSGKKKYDWLKNIDAFIALTDFAKKLFIRSGVPQERIHVKGNSISDPYNGSGTSGSIESAVGAIYVGRISQEKGLLTLMDAWSDIDFPLSIVGDGPLMKEVRRVAPSSVRFLGEQSNKEALRLMGNASLVLFPSLGYEGFPILLLETMALGRPVIASNLGPRGEIVKDGETGLLFEPGDAKSLAEKIRWLLTHPEEMKRMGGKARQLFLEKFTMESNYSQLLQIYQKAQKANLYQG